MTRDEFEQTRPYAMLEDFSRGAGDPDFHGHYPGDPDTKDCNLCNLNNVPSVYRKRHWTEDKSYIVMPAKPAREWGDNNANDPEQAGWDK